MPIHQNWHFTGGPDRGAKGKVAGLAEEIVFVTHPSTGLALIVAVFDHDGTRQSVTLHDPARDVVIVTCGSVFPMAVTLDGRRSECGPHSNDRVTFVPAGTRMVIEHTRDSSMLCALILPAGRLAMMGSGPCPAPFALRDDAALAGLAHAAFRLVLRRSEADNPALEEATARLAAGLVESRPERAERADPRIALPPHKLRRVLAHIEARLNCPITLKELADLAQLSPYHFARVFKQATGRSPYDHVRWRRITRSTALIARSELKIAEISASTGFASAAHFSSAFQRAAGISPLQFRRVVRPRLLSGQSFGPARAN
ncbi:AraC family transcriptional regulator [Erythrobacter sp. CCH5-A1]|jgi:AraC-like DNA-binding protein|uniref:helix-turn-helix transcriptional regulator n=1 Tax=Erythrobacter sp. CCH5-A1 TaxID=1768792 RepID=UPI0008307898|nr:AraC family transcriptional regulator [Erythrobacter sp. CCH5-A1]